MARDWVRLALTGRLVEFNLRRGTASNRAIGEVLDILDQQVRRGAIVVISTHSDRITERCSREFRLGEAGPRADALGVAAQSSVTAP